MTTRVVMPTPSEGAEEATVARWLKSDGASVEAGDELFEIETDKVTVAFSAEAAGFLEIAVAEGTKVRVGDVIAHINGNAKPRGDEPAAPSSTAAAEPEATSTLNAPVAAPPAPPRRADTVRATPLARLVARSHEIDLSKLVGTGPHGIVTRGDVPIASALAAALPGTTRGDRTPIMRELTHAQRLVAQRMSDAKTTVPHFQVQSEAVMDEALMLLARIKSLEFDAPHPSINDLVVKAVAEALPNHPLANGSYREDHFVLHPEINVGVAVAAPGTLVVPVVKNADELSLLEIAAETRRLAERVRAGTATADMLTDATFTVSNLGMFGMTAISPIVNPPQAAILGVGAIRQTVTLEEGEVVARQLMTLTLSCDHRILYGSDAAQFLGAIRELLEQPIRLLLGRLERREDGES